MHKRRRRDGPVSHICLQPPSTIVSTCTFLLQLPLLARVDGLELPQVRRLREGELQPLHPFVTSANADAGLVEGEWPDLAAAARLTRLRHLQLVVRTPLLAANGGAEALNAALASLPHLHGLCLESGVHHTYAEAVQQSQGAVLDVAAVPLLAQLTSLELWGVHLGGGLFSGVSRLTSLRRLQGEQLPSLARWQSRLAARLASSGAAACHAATAAR